MLLMAVVLAAPICVLDEQASHEPPQKATQLPLAFDQGRSPWPCPGGAPNIWERSWDNPAAGQTLPGTVPDSSCEPSPDGAAAFSVCDHIPGRRYNQA